MKDRRLNPKTIAFGEDYVLSVWSNLSGFVTDILRALQEAG
jgi:hypothetical protein